MNYKMTSTTGTSIESYIEWVRKELETKTYGEVTIKFIVTQGYVTDVKTISENNAHFPLPPKGSEKVVK